LFLKREEVIGFGLVAGYATGFACLEMFNKIPTAIKFTNKDEPPSDTKGRGIPLSGANPSIPAIFKKL
jgi:hypothetical protein